MVKTFNLDGMRDDDVIIVTRGSLSVAIRTNDGTPDRPIHISVYRNDDDEQGKCIDICSSGALLIY